MYLRDLIGKWMPTMEHLNMDWKDSVQVRIVRYMDAWLSNYLIAFTFYVTIDLYYVLRSVAAQHEVFMSRYSFREWSFNVALKYPILILSVFTSLRFCYFSSYSITSAQERHDLL